jgi:Mg/Co/Ni transporter MgtE
MLDEETKKNIIAELGIEKLSPEKVGEVMAKLEEQIQRKVVLEILDLLNEEDRRELIEITEPGSGRNISEFLSEKVPMSVVNSLVKAAAESVVKEFKRL